jgi:hypothetical protein
MRRMRVQSAAMGTRWTSRAAVAAASAVVAAQVALAMVMPVQRARPLVARPVVQTTAAQAHVHRVSAMEQAVAMLRIATTIGVLMTTPATTATTDK